MVTHFLLSLFVLTAPQITTENSHLLDAETYARRIHAHLTINDTASALVEAKKAFHFFPTEPTLQRAYIISLAKAHLIEEAIASYESLGEKQPVLLEEIAWGVLEKGQNSTQYAIRLQSLVGAYLARDRRSVQMFLEIMEDSNAILRSVAVQLASSYRDQLLQNKIEEILLQEKTWIVRKEALKAAGVMQMKQVKAHLEGILKSSLATFEEKELVMKSLLAIEEDMDLETLQTMAKSKQAVVRLLACKFVERLDKKEGKEAFLPLLNDTNTQVRIAALQVFSHVFLEDMAMEDAKKHLTKPLLDIHPSVAVTAAWAAVLLDPAYGLPYLEDALLSSSKKKRRLASAALAALGDRGVFLARQFLKETFDPYVKAHLAICLIGQRKHLPEAMEALYTFFMKKQTKLQYGRYGNTPFFVLEESQAPYLPQVPNYPEVIDEVAQLQILSFLAILQEESAKKAMETFLRKKTWGISSFASSLLMKEGSEDSLVLIRDLLNSKEPLLRLQAAIVLAHLGKEEKALLVLKDLYFTQKPYYKKKILEAMGLIASKESAPFFLQALHEPSEMLRVLAAASLLQSLKR